jgi:hypothetical protein
MLSSAKPASELAAMTVTVSNAMSFFIIHG